MAKARQQRGRAPKGRSDLVKLAMSDSDNELEIDDGLLKMHDGTAAADRCAGSSISGSSGSSSFLAWTASRKHDIGAQLVLEDVACSERGRGFGSSAALQLAAPHCCCLRSHSDDGLDEEAVYGLDDSDSDEGESSDDEEEEGDSEDALEEALLRGGRHAQREC